MIYKGLIPFSLTILFAWLLPSFGPWYLVVMAGFLGGLFSGSQWRGLYLGFAAGSSLWLFQMTLAQIATHSDLPERMARLVEVANTDILNLLTALIGGAVTGVGGAAGGALVNKRDWVCLDQSDII